MDLEKPAPRQEQQPVATDRRSAPVRQDAPAEGCLVVAIRLPVRIVVLVLVVPVRMAWDALVVGGRLLRDTVLRPLGRALLWVGRAVLVWPWVALWRYVVVPVAKGIGWLGNVLLVVPAVWVYRYVLTPVGHGIAWVARGVRSGAVLLGRGIATGLAWVYARVLTPVGHGLAWLAEGIGIMLAAVGLGVYTAVAWLVRYLLVVPAVWLYPYLLTPVGHGIAWVARGVWAGITWLASGVVGLVRMILTGVWLALYWTGRVLLVLPAVAVWRWVLVPLGRALAVVGREIRDALGHAWRIAGYVSLAVGRFLGTLFRWVFVEPARWVYRTVLTPLGHLVRDAVWRPAAEAARAVGRATRQALASARESVRQVRADVRRALFGEPAKREPAARRETRREPVGRETRTLGSSTTALTKD